MRFVCDRAANGSIDVVTVAGATQPAWLDGGWRIQQGSTAFLLVNLVNGDEGNTAWDLTAFSATLKARRKYGDADTLFTATSASGITVAHNLPNIAVKLTPSVTAELDFTGGVFDLEVSLGSEVMKVLAGQVYLAKEAAE